MAKRKLKVGDAVVVEIWDSGKKKSEWVDATVTAKTSIGINVRTYWGREYHGCHPKCVRRI